MKKLKNKIYEVRINQRNIMNLNNEVEFPFQNEELEKEKRVEDLLNRLTMKEKFRLLAGHNFWSTKPIKRLGIKSMGMTDGPVGVAWHSSHFHKNTQFPKSICLSSSWNRDNSEKLGIAIAQEVRANGRHIILGPGINIDRTPLNGRTFEYLSEDPFLTKEMAIPFVKGVQSQRIGACVKHFVANNQETNRMKISSEVSKRALKEIYLKAFHDMVKESDPWSIMACYNKINGIYGSENKKLIRETLMDGWGFHGFVMTDWYASKRIETTENCINAGLSLEMPKNIRYTSKNLQIAYDKKKFSEEALDFVVKRLLRIMFLVGIFDDEKKLPQGSRNTPEHQKIARKIAEEGIVLLKNDDNILPLDASKIKKITILGPNAKKKTGKPLFGGSAAVVPPYEITPFVGLKKKCNKEKIEIVKDPADADVAILVLGLNHKFYNDSEGSDRKRLELPEKQVKLIKQTVTQNPNTIVVLINGSPIAMEDWIGNVPAILEAWYPGMEGGNVIADILFGNINPSGKLPITFPKKLSDSPAHKSERTFPGDGEKVFYDEGIYVGYRHFDKEHIDPLFPFGFGLSYTEFKYSNLRISKEKFSKNESIEVSVDIMNKGTRSGAEIVQLYIEDLESRIDRPPKELKGFKRIQLEPQEKKEMKFTLYPENFAFYDDSVHDWVIEPGFFKILVGSSSRDIRLQEISEYLE